MKQRSGGMQFGVAQADTLQDPILKNPSQKRAGLVAEGVGPEFNPVLQKTKTKTKTKTKR
jgi:hypothetical protein